MSKIACLMKLTPVMMVTSSLLIPVFCYSASVPAAISVAKTIHIQDPVLKTAIDRCVKQGARLKRLACFDALFSTPTQVNSDEYVNVLRSEEWQRAWNSEAIRTTQTGFIVNSSDKDDPRANIWFTQSAQSRSAKSKQDEYKIKFAPILMLSCMDNISRVELALPNALKKNNIDITFSHHKGQMTTNWLSDEDGMILRSGRGLDAISIMKFLTDSNRIKLRSDVSSINGLEFSTQGLSNSIALLRYACHW